MRPNPTLYAVVAGLFAIATAGAVAAQTPLPPADLGQVSTNAGVSNSSGVNIASPNQMGIVATSPSRMSASRREMNAGRTNPRAVADLPDDPAIILEEAQIQADRADAVCDVTEAAVVGAARENMPIFEAVCSQGTGYIIVSGAYPQAVDCALLADGTGDRRRDRDMVVINECRLPGNQMTLARISTYARSAGVDCDIADGAQIGRTNSGAVFEVGCRSGEGYWVRQSDNAWSRENCLKVIALNDTCRFTTAEQRARALDARLRGTEAAGCNVSAIGYVGQAGSDEYYEVRCAAGQGFVLRVGPSERVDQALSCAQAEALLGATCRL